MTHDIRLIALDLDGTLLNEKGLLTSRSARALTCAHEQGIFIAAATGRAFCALPTDVRALPAISYIITSNGTGIYQMPEEKRIYTNAMSRENLEQLLPLLDTFSCPIEAYIDGTAYASADYVENPEAFHLPPRSCAYVQATRRPCPDMGQLIRSSSAPVEGISAVLTAPEARAALREAAGKIPDLYVTSSAPHFIEFAAGSASKESALRVLTQLLGITSAQVMAFGDAENDAEMLSFAGIGVAMGNAAEILKQIADMVTASNAEDGVAQAIERLMGKADRMC